MVRGGVSPRSGVADAVWLMVLGQVAPAEGFRYAMTWRSVSQSARFVL
jgi:hypothetical protein